MTDSTAWRLVLLSIVALLAARSPSALAQLAPPAKEIPLYSGDAPGSETWTWSERDAGSPSNPTVQNVVHPELMYYPADKATAVGTAVIVAPGGGFQNLMMSYEGVDIAKRFNAMGVDAFVLKYRLRHIDPSARRAAAATTQPTASEAAANAKAREEIASMAGADGRAAISILRQSATDYGFSPNRIGLIGFSAGGAVVMRTMRGPFETRPNFAMALYAAEANGDPPPPGAPPLFIAVAADDQSVGWKGSFDLFGAWRTAKIPVELHIFQTGRHGFRTKGGGADHFMDRVEEWVKVNGFLGKAVN